jgi:hypothetical protein
MHAGVVECDSLPEALEDGEEEEELSVDVVCLIV